MEYYFKEHIDESLVTKTVGYRSFPVIKGKATVADVPDIDPELTGKAKDRATKRRQAEVEAWNEAARELGGVPMAEVKVKTETKAKAKGGKN